MKIYSVKPNSLFIRVSDGRTLVGDGGDIAWGDSSVGAFYLMKAILKDVLGDATRATNLAQRAKWRTVVNWPADTPHAITENEVHAVVDDIERVAKENAPMVERAMREKPMFVSDRAAPGQVWDSNPELKRKETPNVNTGKPANDGDAAK